MEKVEIRRAVVLDAGDISRLVLASTEEFLPAVFGPRFERAQRSRSEPLFLGGRYFALFRMEKSLGFGLDKERKRN